MELSPSKTSQSAHRQLVRPAAKPTAAAAGGGKSNDDSDSYYGGSSSSSGGRFGEDYENEVLSAPGSLASSLSGSVGLGLGLLGSTSLAAAGSRRVAVGSDNGNHSLRRSASASVSALIEDKANLEWNEKYQLLVDSLPTEFISSTEQFASVSSFCFDLLRLSKDFVHLANLYGKIIISEKALAEEVKTIKPISIGGFAGGRKYLKRGILFKFPQVDEYGIYAGVDEWAAKAGGHELKGLIGFKMADVRDLRLPLLALIDYRGYRLCALSTLPITKETLVYGSGDGAKTVVNRDPVASSLMDEFGRRMNLKPHVAGREVKTTIVGPADIEVHKGLDGRYYVIDHARVFPPEAPQASRTHLFNLLRPEFVKKYPVPLSSDAFSKMGGTDAPESTDNNDDIRTATEHLISHVIPEFVQAFEAYLGAEEGQLIEKAALYSDIAGNVFKKAQKTLIEELHRFGINIRHLGEVRTRATSAELRRVILVEMIARVLKINLRKRWRQQMEKFPSSETESFKHTTAKYLNLALGTSDKSSLYWAFELIPQLTNKYKCALSKAERNNSRSMAADGHLKRIVLLRVSQLCGILFSPKFSEKLSEDPEWFNQERPIPELHIFAIEPVIKTTNTIPYIEGLLLLHSARRSSSGKDKTVADTRWTLKSAARKFKEAVRVAPGGRAEILALSYVCFQRAALNVTIEKAVRLLDMAQHKLSYLLKTFEGDPVAFVLFADVVQLSGIFRNNVDILHEAVSHYEKHLETVPLDAHACLQCGKSYLYIYYYGGKQQDVLVKAHNMAKRATEVSPDDGEAWLLLARTISLQNSKEKDPAAYALCDDAFSRAHLLSPSNVEILYRWGRFLLKKARAFDNLDAMLVAAMKLKAAVEKDPKIDHYNDIRDCIVSLEEKLRSPKNFFPTATTTTVNGWIRVLRQAVEKWNQFHKNAHGDILIIDWDDIDILHSLGQADFKFVFKAIWHPHKNSLTSSGNNILEKSASTASLPVFPRTSLSETSPPASHNSSPALTPNSGGSKTPSPLIKSMSTIFSSPRANKEVAVKLLKRNNAVESDRAKFENELKVFANMGRHPNIAALYGISHDEQHIAIIREYFHFGSALVYLAREYPHTHADPGFWDAVYRLVLDAAEALAFLHESHIVFNNMTAYQAYVSDRHQVKLSDFHNAVILQPDDALAEIQMRNEVAQYGLFLWEIASMKNKADVPELANATPAALPIDPSWPEQYKALIRSCTRNDLEPKLTMREVVSRIKNVLFGLDKSDIQSSDNNSNSGSGSCGSGDEAESPRPAAPTEDASASTAPPVL